MEIKGSALYQAQSSQVTSAAKPADVGLAQSVSPQSKAVATDTVSISAEATALLSAESGAQPVPPPPIKPMSDGEPPPWPPTTDD